MSDELDPITGGNGHTLTNGEPVNPMELRALEAEFKVLESSILLARATFMRQAGITYEGQRDEYATLGYDRQITNAQYRDEYARGGIAGRIIDVMPDACWRGDPAMELIENEDPNTETPFEKVWKTLDTEHQICAKLQRVDKLARLSTYAALLIGAPGHLDEELPKGAPDKLLYLMPFSGGGGPGGPGGSEQSRTATMDADCAIAEYDTDPESPRFGLPTKYQLRRTDVASPHLSRPVHWTRVIHIAEGLLDDEVFGQPALQRVWNLLIDLRKVTGGGAEAFWLRANAGLHLDIDKDMVLDKDQYADVLTKLKEQSELYKHQLTRWLKTRGVNVQQLGSDVANFANPADAIITQIAGAKSIPKRILTGSEMGELASSQDRENFKDQVNGRQTQYCGPYIARPLADRLIKYGYLETPAKGPKEYKVLWPHIQVLTEQEKADGAQKWAATNQTQGEPVFTDAEIRDKWYAMEPLTDQQRAEIDERKQKAMEMQQAMMAPPGAPVAPDVPVDGGTLLDFNVDDIDGEDEEDEDEPPKVAIKTAAMVVKFDENKHKRNKGMFSSTAGPSASAPMTTRAPGSGGTTGTAKGKEPPAGWKPEMSGDKPGYKNPTTGQWVPADHPIITGVYDKPTAVKKVRVEFKKALTELKDGLAEDESEALSKAYEAAKKTGFEGSELAFFHQQLELYRTAKEGDPNIKTYFYAETMDAYTKMREEVVAKTPGGKAEKEKKETEKKAKSEKKAKGGTEKKAKGESKKEKKDDEKDDEKPKDSHVDPAALGDLMKNLATDEKQALEEGYAREKEQGFRGTLVDFFKEQLELYDDGTDDNPHGSVEEGDPRLKTFFYGATITAFRKLPKEEVKAESPVKKTPTKTRKPRAAEESEDAELLRVLTAALECGHTEVVHRILGLDGSTQVPRSPEIAAAAFNPDQPRDETGQWTGGGSGVVPITRDPKSGFPLERSKLTFDPAHIMWSSKRTPGSLEQRQKLFEVYESLDKALSDPEIGQELWNMLSSFTPKSLKIELEGMRTGVGGKQDKKMFGGKEDSPRRIVAAEDSPKLLAAIDQLLALMNDPDTGKAVEQMLQYAIEQGDWAAVTQVMKPDA